MILSSSQLVEFYDIVIYTVYTLLHLSLGTLFLWLFWPSFNGALIGGDARYRAIVNTYFSLSGSVLMSFVISMLLDPKRKLDIVRCYNTVYV